MKVLIKKINKDEEVSIESRVLIAVKYIRDEFGLTEVVNSLYLDIETLKNARSSDYDMEHLKHFEIENSNSIIEKYENIQRIYDELNKITKELYVEYATSKGEVDIEVEFNDSYKYPSLVMKLVFKNNKND